MACALSGYSSLRKLAVQQGWGLIRRSNITIQMQRSYKPENEKYMIDPNIYFCRRITSGSGTLRQFVNVKPTYKLEDVTGSTDPLESRQS